MLTRCLRVPSRGIWKNTIENVALFHLVTFELELAFFHVVGIEE